VITNLENIFFTVYKNIKMFWYLYWKTRQKYWARNFFIFFFIFIFCRAQYFHIHCSFFLLLLLLLLFFSMGKLEKNAP